MEDVKALIVRNDLNLPSEVTSDLLARFNRKSVSYLSPEKEAAPFLFYCLGDDFKKIAIRTNYPVDVIILTAMYYRWPEKKEILQREHVDMVPAEIKKDLTNSLLVATYMAVQKQLSDVMAGRRKPENCPLIPNNMLALEKLLGLVDQLAKADKGAPLGNTVVHADNVQINQGLPPERTDNSEDPEAAGTAPEERQAMLESMEDE